MPPLRCLDLTFSYQNKTLFKDINLQFQAGQFVALIGANGIGKSTLLKLLLGLTPLQSGSVMLNGENINTIKRREIAQKIAFVPQSTELPYAFSVQDIVAMGRNPYLGAFEINSKNDLSLIESAMHKTDIIHLKERIVNTLSGGEKQRVIIARALAQQSLTILLDEPIASLDICHQLETLQLIQSLTQSGQLAISALHDLNLAARFCQRLILLGPSKNNDTTTVVADGTPEEVLTNENLKRCFSIQADIIKNDKTLYLANISPISGHNCNG